MEYKPKGTHYLIDFFNCDASLLDDKRFIQETILETAGLARTTVLHSYFHEFEPVGITGSVVIAESHINIHTWPEHGYAAVDVFTCGDNLFPKLALEFLGDKLKAKRSQVKQHKRGFD